MAGLTPSLSFLKSQWRFLLFGFLLAFFSSPGQTFFISLFSGHIRQTLNLTHGDFGTIYAIGTIASAATLIPLGRLVDTIKLRSIALAIIAGLSTAMLFFSTISSIATLIIGIYALRLAGQGMMSHLFATAITRRYVAERGRAYAIAAFGHPISEFIMPIIIIALLANMDWRHVWQTNTALVIAIMIPATLLLTARNKGQDGKGHKTKLQKIQQDTVSHGNTGQGNASHGNTDQGNTGQGNAGWNGQHWTRKQMLLNHRFWLLAGLVIAPSFTTTGLFFHQIYFAQIKNIPIADWVTGFAFFATASIIGSFIGGGLVDRFSSAKTAPYAVAAIAIAVTMLYILKPGPSVYAYFTIFGFLQGHVMTITAPIWAEIYGTKHLGGIKAIAQSMMVFASALSPVILGIMIDAGLSLESLLLVLGTVPLIAGMLAYLGTRKTNGGKHT